jgi:hypothetical protein
VWQPMGRRVILLKLVKVLDRGPSLLHLFNLVDGVLNRMMLAKASDKGLISGLMRTFDSAVCR